MTQRRLTQYVMHFEDIKYNLEYIIRMHYNEALSSGEQKPKF